MPIEWVQGEVRARCPVCGTDGSKATLLTAEHVIPGVPRITFLRCAHCGAAFLDDLTAPDYGLETPQMLDYYVEQGAGIDLVVAPLLRVPPKSVRRCLEVGCSFPFALDFARFSFGWEVLGVDPSPLAVKGAAALGVPVLHTYFDAQLDVGADAFDLVLCSEILEHVADPHSLLSAIHGRLSREGMLVLSTPNANIVRPETEEGMLARALSPGFHLVLYDRASLTRVLSMAGFTSIVIEESPETLRAFASSSAAAMQRLLPRDPDAERALLRDYLDTRKKEVPATSSLACGFAYRHFKECVNAGLYDDAIASRDFLAKVYAACYGFDFPNVGTNIPFNLSCALFFSGILELNHLQRPDRAAACFAAAIDVAEKIRGGALPFAIFDGETEMLLRQSRKHLPMALAAFDPDEAVRAVERLPPSLFDETYAPTFERLVNAGAFAQAKRLARRGDTLAPVTLSTLPRAPAGSRLL
ncbi:MAG TPA: class I SAM-dependent methyltransferase, partial [Thermoanaerobaculia bacterium]|nr:class I SAM-dependent methyltransferase [Thermoanaerobaculia bacterium]